MTKSESVIEFAVEIDYPKFALSARESVPLSGVTALVGESGAGKSTLLRILAGIERSARGTVRFRDRIWMDTDAGVFVPAHMRAVGVVFQEGRLFPHLSVSGNLVYGFKRRRGREGSSWDEVCDALDLGPLLDRQTQNLSGGEQQRVALGRALLSAPELLLLDEPLASLDSDSKEEIIPYLRRVISGFGLPAIYISHSREELKTLVDNILTVQDGRIVSRSADEAGPDHRQLLRAAVVRDLGPGLLECRIGHDEVVARIEGEASAVPGSNTILAFMDTDLAVSLSGDPNAISAGTIAATVETVEQGACGSDLVLTLATDGGKIKIRQFCGPPQVQKPVPGQRVGVAFIRSPRCLR